MKEQLVLKLSKKIEDFTLQEKNQIIKLLHKNQKNIPYNYRNIENFLVSNKRYSDSLELFFSYYENELNKALKNIAKNILKVDVEQSKKTTNFDNIEQTITNISLNCEILKMIKNIFSETEQIAIIEKFENLKAQAYEKVDLINMQLSQNEFNKISKDKIDLAVEKEIDKIKGFNFNISIKDLIELCYKATEIGHSHNSIDIDFSKNEDEILKLFYNFFAEMKNFNILHVVLMNIFTVSLTLSRYSKELNNIKQKEKFISSSIQSIKAQIAFYEREHYKEHADIYKEKLIEFEANQEESFEIYKEDIMFYYKSLSSLESLFTTHLSVIFKAFNSGKTFSTYKEIAFNSDKQFALLELQDKIFFVFRDLYDAEETKPHISHIFEDKYEELSKSFIQAGSIKKEHLTVDVDKITIEDIINLYKRDECKKTSFENILRLNKDINSDFYKEYFFNDSCNEEIQVSM